MMVAYERDMCAEYVKDLYGPHFQKRVFFSRTNFTLVYHSEEQFVSQMGTKHVNGQCDNVTSINGYSVFGVGPRKMFPGRIDNKWPHPYGPLIGLFVIRDAHI